ncbi:hypothetical protein FPOAC2_04669 [Fusarium poae]
MLSNTQSIHFISKVDGDEQWAKSSENNPDSTGRTPCLTPFNRHLWQSNQINPLLLQCRQTLFVPEAEIEAETVAQGYIPIPCQCLNGYPRQPMTPLVFQHISLYPDWRQYCSIGHGSGFQSAFSVRGFSSLI